MKKLFVLFLLSFLLLCSSVFAAAGDKFMQQGKKLYAAKKYSQAYSAFEKAAKASPKNSAAYLYMGYCKVALKDRAGAVKNFDKSLAIKNDPKLKKYVENLKGSGSKAASRTGGGVPYYYTGGQNRLLAMANPVISVKDASTSLDTYLAGRNAAGLGLRRKQNMIIVDLSYWSMGTKAEGEVFTLPFSNETSIAYFVPGGDPRRNLAAATYWFSNDDVLNLNLGLGLMGMSTKTLMFGINTEVKEGATVLMSSLEYSRRIMKGFTLGVAAGGITSWFNNAIGGAITESRTNGSKIDWQVSGAYELGLGEGNLTAGLTVGDINPVTVGDDMTLWKEKGSVPPTDYIDGMSINSATVSEAGDLRTENNSKIDASGLNTSVSGTYKSGSLEAIALFGITAGIGGTTSGNYRIIQISTGTEVTSVQLDPYTSASDGSLFSTRLKGRYSLDIVDIGLAFTGSWGSLKMFAYEDDPNPVARSVNKLRVDAGAALKIKEFTIPVEVGFDMSGYTDAAGNTQVSNYSTIIVKAGCEYKLSKELAVRAGFSYTTSSQTQSFNGTAGPNPGEAGNPVNSGIGLHAGAGYTMGKIEIDAALALRLLGMNPLGANVTSYSGTEVLASVGANIPL